MEFCGLSDEFLEDAKRVGSYDPNTPFQFRVMAKALMENDYDTARKLLEANPTEFEGDYGYMVLDDAVEMCLNTTVEQSVNGRCIKKPTTETVEFIEYLLKNGADPHLPINFDQIEHINDVEEDGSHQCRCEFDCSEVRELLMRYM